jgi:hypothetical protein
MSEVTTTAGANYRDSGFARMTTCVVEECGRAGRDAHSSR